MDSDISSAIQYARKYNLFRSYNASPFSPSSCAAAVQESLPIDPIDMLAHDDTLDQIQLPKTSPDSETISVIDTKESRAPIAHLPQDRFQLMEALRMETPDFGLADASGFGAYSKSVSAIRYPSLVSQRLPLLAVDVKRDQGLPFPPHVDRLYNSLLMEVVNERLPTHKPKGQGNSYFPSTSSQECVYLPDDSRLTEPPPSRHATPVQNTDTSIAQSQTGQLEQKSTAAVVQSISSNPDESPCTSLPSAWRDADQTRDDQHIRPNKATNLPLEPEIDNANFDIATKTTPLLVGEHGSPFGSYFEDAFFTHQELIDMEDHGHVNMKDAGSRLSRIQALILPVPDLQTLAPNPTTTHFHPWSGDTPRWQTAAAAAAAAAGPLLPVDPAREAALPWTPLPLGTHTGGAFLEEEILLSGASSAFTTSAAAAAAAKESLFLHADDGYSHRDRKPAKIFDLSDDHVVPVPPKPVAVQKKRRVSPRPESNVLLGLPIKRQERAPPPAQQQQQQHQQKVAVESAARDMGKKKDTLLGNASPKPPILAIAGDPMATSNLVAAFMALRGTKQRPRGKATGKHGAEMRATKPKTCLSK